MTINLTDIFFILCWFIGLALLGYVVLAIGRAFRRF